MKKIRTLKLGKMLPALIKKRVYERNEKRIYLFYFYWRIFYVLVLSGFTFS